VCNSREYSYKFIIFGGYRNVFDRLGLVFFIQQTNNSQMVYKPKKKNSQMVYKPKKNNSQMVCKPTKNNSQMVCKPTKNNSQMVCKPTKNNRQLRSSQTNNYIGSSQAELADPVVNGWWVQRLLRPGNGQRPPPLQWYGEKKQNRKTTPAPTRRRSAPRVTHTPQKPTGDQFSMTK